MNWTNVTLKIISVFLSLLLLTLGIFCIATGSLTISSYSSEYYNGEFGLINVQKELLIITIIILFVIGLVFLFGGFLGLYTGCVKRKNCQWLFIGFLSLTLMLIITMFALSIVFRDKLEESIETSMNSALREYDYNPMVRTAVDKIQIHFHCCGVNSVKDWWVTPQGKAPDSCGNGTMSNYNETLVIEGCYSKLERNVNFIIGGAAVLMTLITLGIVASLLINYFKNCKERNYVFFREFHVIVKFPVLRY